MISFTFYQKNQTTKQVTVVYRQYSLNFSAFWKYNTFELATDENSPLDFL